MIVTSTSPPSSSCTFGAACNGCAVTQEYNGQVLTMVVMTMTMLMMMVLLFFGIFDSGVLLCFPVWFRPGLLSTFIRQNNHLNLSITPIIIIKKYDRCCLKLTTFPPRYTSGKMKTASIATVAINNKLTSYQNKPVRLWQIYDGSSEVLFLLWDCWICQQLLFTRQCGCF